MQFVVQSGAEPGKTYDLVPNVKYSIGRQSANDVVVSDEQVSRRHAEVQVVQSGILVTDLGSSNGTFINGTRVSSPQTIRPGDTLQVGTTVLRLVDSQNADSTLPAGYDQPAPATSSYSNNGYAAAANATPSSSAASSPAVNYGAYNQSGTPNPTYGQGFNQTQPPANSVSYSPAPAGSNSYNNNAYQPNAYNNNAANNSASAAKKGLPPALIITIAVIVVVIILAIILIVVLGGHHTTTSLLLPNSLTLTLYNLAVNMAILL